MESEESASYPGLMTRYILYTVEVICDGLPDGDFYTTEYENAKDITRRRLYLEAMQKALPKVGDLTLVDGEGGGLLKLLDLSRKEGK